MTTIDTYAAKTGRMLREDDTTANLADGLNADGSVNVTNADQLKSLLGKYFVGQTEDLTISGTTNGWAQLVNPAGSGVRVHLNVWTTSNLSSKIYTVGVFFDAGFPVATTLSTRVMAANLTEPKPTAKAQIRYLGNTAEIPTGLEVYTRRVPQETTLASDENAKFIIPPGKSIGLYMSATTASGVCRAAFGWWEEPLA